MFVKFTGIINSGDIDYDSETVIVTFATQDTSAKFCVNIIDDTSLEENESFSLGIDVTSLSTGVTLGNFHTAIVTILDNECMQSTYIKAIILMHIS